MKYCKDMYSTEQKEDIIKNVCLQIIKGKSINSIFENSPDLPNESTFYDWINKMKNFPRNTHGRVR